MKLLFSLLLVGLGTFPAEAQAQSDSNSIFLFVEQMPEFPGGQSNMLTYLNTHMQYPESARQKGIGGRVVVRFVIWRDGTLRNAEVMRATCTSGPDCEALKKEALRMVNSMPAWKPGKQNGRPVNIYFTLPVTFKPGIEAGAADNDVIVPAPEPSAQSNGTGTDAVLSMVEQMPEFPGGIVALKKYIADNQRYPSIALENEISGRVFVQFVVTKEGRIKDAKIVKGFSASGSDATAACMLLNNEALRLVNSMPVWKPGKQNGSPVNVIYNLPIQFRLPDDGAAQENRSAEAAEIMGRIDKAEMIVPPPSEMPQFPGGDNKLLEYITRNLEYPEIAKREGAYGKVMVRFMVASDGTIKDAKVQRQDCLNHTTDEACKAMKAEALRLISQMPKWKPAKQHGKLIDMVYTLPIDFQLDK